MFQRFDSLGEQLLRAGIAPRHVRRFVRELNDHVNDLLRENLQNGMTMEIAEMEARRRIGTDRDLVAAMLTHSDLRSLSARFPLVVFGVAPVLIFVGSVVAAVMAGAGIIFGHVAIAGAGTTGTHPEWLRMFVWTWNATVNYALPLGIAALSRRLAPGNAFHRDGSAWVWRSRALRAPAILCLCVGRICPIRPCYQSASRSGRHFPGK